MDSKEFHTVRGYQLIDQNKGLLTPAMEDYLEMIYRNSEPLGFIRLNKLATLLNVKDSSASKMVQKLGEMRLLKYERYGVIILSEKGKHLGEFLLDRHNTIERFLETIGVKDDLLAQTELMEHSVSINTLNYIKKLNEFLNDNPEIINRFHKYRSSASR